MEKIATFEDVAVRNKCHVTKNTRMPLFFLCLHPMVAPGNGELLLLATEVASERKR